MTDSFINTASDQPLADKTQLLALHVHLQDLLAGYGDQELDAQDTLLVEAHLSGCNDCRNDLARQQLLSQHIAAMPIEGISPQAYKKMQHSLLAEDKVAEQSPKLLFAFKNKLTALISTLTPVNATKAKLFGASGWAVAIIVTISLMPLTTITQPHSVHSANTNIPMIEDALEQYYSFQQQDLPTELMVNSAPATWKNSRVLASWSTLIGGAPAEVFAMRHNNNIVLQYKIDETVFFRNAQVRQALANQGLYQTTASSADIMVLPSKNGGLIIVGPSNSLPKRDNIQLRSI